MMPMETRLLRGTAAVSGRMAAARATARVQNTPTMPMGTILPIGSVAVMGRTAAARTTVWVPPTTPTMRMEIRHLSKTVGFGVERPAVSGGNVDTILTKSNFPGSFWPGDIFCRQSFPPKKYPLRGYNPLLWLDEPPDRLLC